MLQAAALKQLARDHALVDEINLKIARPQLSIFELKLARIGNHRLISFRLEKLPAQLELDVSLRLAPIHDGDARAPAAAPFVIALDQRREQARTNRHAPHGIAPREFADDFHFAEDIAEHVTKKQPA